MSAEKPDLNTGEVAGATQVERTCKAILRTIWVSEYKPGDRLPSHRDFMEAFGVSNNTMKVAMSRLVEEGVLGRSPRKGTFLLDPDAYSLPLWRVGVFENFQDTRFTAPFSLLLGAYVQKALARAGGWSRLYFHRMRDGVSPGRISDYPDYAADVGRRILDGAIALGDFDPAGCRAVAPDLPLCGFNERIGCGAAIDHVSFRQDAHRMLSELGCSRIHLVDLKSGTSDFIVRSEDGRVTGVSLVRSPLEMVTSFFIKAGRRLAEELLRLPAARRPDGLIVSDDYIAAGLAERIGDSDAYRPGIAVLALVQNPLVYSIPVIRLGVDIAELAQAGVSVLVERLRNPALPPRLEKVRPRQILRPDLQGPTASGVGERLTADI